MKKFDRTISIMLILFAGFAYYLSYSFPTLGVTETGPSFFPQLVSIGIIFLSVLLLFNSFRGESEGLEFGSFKRVFIVIVILVFYLIGFLYIGFFVSSVISLILIMYVMGIRKILTSFLVSIISTLVIYLIFVYVFNVPLPEGILI